MFTNFHVHLVGVEHLKTILAPLESMLTIEPLYSEGLNPHPAGGQNLPPPGFSQ